MILESNLLEIAILLVINSLSIFMIILILANSLEGNANLWFVLMTLSLIVWINSAYLGFSLEDSSSATFFYKLNDVSVALFLITAYKFYVRGFLGIKSKLFELIHYTVCASFIFLAVFTGATIESVIQEPWGNETVSGVAFDIFIAYVFFATFALIVTFIYRYSRYSEIKQRQAKYFLIGTITLVLLNIIFNVITPLIFSTARFQHLGDYSAIFFLGFTAYAILKDKFLNVKVALTAFLIGIIGMLIILDILLLSRNIGEQAVKSVILVFFAIISVFLVRSVLREIRQKEELEKVNKALDKSRQRYLDLATEQKDIIDVMGHEIRTPLTAIVQEIKLHKKHTLPLEKELLAEGKGENLKKLLPLIFDTLKTVDRASGHAVALVSDMLETARLDKKRFTLNYEKFDLVSVAAQSVELMTKTVEADTRAGAVKYDVRFVKPSFETLEIEADKTRIGQAMYAMLNNAIKYRDPGKDVVKVRLTLAKKSGEVVIEIVDNGIGIAEEDISKLGKKFLRLNPKTNGNLERPGGTGLGLFVVKGIMEYHHGRLEIESDGITKGSTFRLRFPLTKVEKN